MFFIAIVLIPVTPVRTLRSANKNLLAVPSSRTILADRAFSRAAPTVWNALPHLLPLYLSFIQKSSQNPFISAGPRHIIQKSAPLNLVLVPRIMALYKFTYLLTYLRLKANVITKTTLPSATYTDLKQCRDESKKIVRVTWRDTLKLTWRDLLN